MALLVSGASDVWGLGDQGRVAFGACGVNTVVIRSLLSYRASRVATWKLGLNGHNTAPISRFRLRVSIKRVASPVVEVVLDMRLQVQEFKGISAHK